MRSLRIRGSIKNVKPTSVAVGADVPRTPGSPSLQTCSNTPSCGGISPLDHGDGRISGVGVVAAATTNHSSSASNSMLMEESGYMEARDGPITQKDWDYIESIASDEDDDDSTDSTPTGTVMTLNSSSSLSSRHLLARKRDLLRLLSVEGQKANMQKRRNRTLALGLGTTATTTSGGADVIGATQWTR